MTPANSKGYVTLPGGKKWSISHFPARPPPLKRRDPCCSMLLVKPKLHATLIRPDGDKEWPEARGNLICSIILNGMKDQRGFPPPPPTHTHTCVCLYVHACPCVCVYACVCACVYAHTCTCMHAHTEYFIATLNRGLHWRFTLNHHTQNRMYHTEIKIHGQYELKSCNTVPGNLNRLVTVYLRSAQ